MIKLAILIGFGVCVGIVALIYVVTAELKDKVVEVKDKLLSDDANGDVDEEDQ